MTPPLVTCDEAHDLLRLCLGASAATWQSHQRLERQNARRDVEALYGELLDADQRVVLEATCGWAVTPAGLLARDEERVISPEALFDRSLLASASTDWWDFACALLAMRKSSSVFLISM